MDAESLKQLLGTPMALLLVMIAGALGSAFKQMAMARRESGLKISATGYLLNYWPETLIAVGGVIGGFLTLLFTDQLNFASAILGGYTANSAADVFTKDGRSADLQSPSGTSLDKDKQGGFIRPWVLALLLGVGLIGTTIVLPGCAELGVPKATTLPERFAAAELSVNGSVASATTLLNAGAISVADAKAFRELAVSAHELLGAAEAAYEAGNVAEATDRLAVAESVLKSVRAYLVAREGGGS